MADLADWMKDAGDAWRSMDAQMFYCRGCKEFGVLLFPVDVCPRCRSSHETLSVSEFLRQARDLVGRMDEENGRSSALELAISLIEHIFCQR